MPGYGLADGQGSVLQYDGLLDYWQKNTIEALRLRARISQHYRWLRNLEPTVFVTVCTRVSNAFNALACFDDTAKYRTKQFQTKTHRNLLPENRFSTQLANDCWNMHYHLPFINQPVVLHKCRPFTGKHEQHCVQHISEFESFVSFFN